VRAVVPVDSGAPGRRLPPDPQRHRRSLGARQCAVALSVRIHRHTLGRCDDERTLR